MAVTLWVIRPTGRWKETEGRAPLHLLPLAIALAVFCLFIIVVFSLAGRAPPRERTLSGQAIGSGTTTLTATAATADPARSYTPDFKWPAAIAVAALLLAAFAAAALAARQRGKRRAGATAADLAEELVTLVDLALDDLRAEPDPRTAVIAAYARMERALAAYGIPRRAFEAPFEYLERVSPDLRESLPSAQRLVFELTHLFERAKFSAHEIDASMKDEAIATLTTLRDELEASREEEHGTAAA